ncbi:hypothetical protein PILCRDRAFT_726183 [Piloderma croceum F 1598]|uniref:Uncharacterized protein n=1 Tax=Piloderma croceum (strain F 1598) TaxID=765440 RepID=A0A0C3AI57_PILCF|nr:hypothetical protein PILCRDRAFT_726183 [Piloderma croceum F 1598]
MRPPPTIPSTPASPAENRGEEEKVKAKSKSTAKGKVKETAGNRKHKRSNDEAYQGNHDLTAESLVQQAWAQAVRVDGTIIVFHSGNLRPHYRDTQTLRFRPHRTSYVQGPQIRETPSWYLCCSCPRYDGSYEAAVA